MISLFKRWYQNHFSQPGTTEFAFVLICAFLVIYYLMWLVGPLVVALCLAYCLDSSVRLILSKTRCSRTVASAFVMLVFTGFLVGITVLLVPRVIKQGSELFSNLEDAEVSQVYQQRNLDANEQGIDGISGNVSVEHSNNTMTAEDLNNLIAKKIYEFIEPLPEPLPSMITQQNISDTIKQAREAVIVNISQIFRNQVMPSVVNAFTWLMYLIIVPIFTFLMLSGKRELLSRVRTYMLPNNQVLMKEFWPKINNQIESYIRGKLIHVIIITCANTINFLAFGLNYSFILGLGVGISVIIPYVGAVLIALPVLVVSVMQFGFTMTLLWLWVAYVVIQLLDSNVLTPLLFSKTLNLDAFSILAAILIFGGLWGFWGVFFSIPLATFIRTIIIYWPSRDSLQSKTESHKISYTEKR